MVGWAPDALPWPGLCDVPYPYRACRAVPCCVADKVGALLMMDMAHISGLVAAQEAAQVGGRLRVGAGASGVRACVLTVQKPVWVGLGYVRGACTRGSRDRAAPRRWEARALPSVNLGSLALPCLQLPSTFLHLHPCHPPPSLPSPSLPSLPRPPPRRSRLSTPTS